MKIFSLDEYCSQKVRDIVQKTNIVFEHGTPKVDILTKAAPYYYHHGLITEETFKLMSDPRFVRLYNAKVKSLQKLLAEKNIASPNQGKAKIVQLCYDNGIDLDITNSPNKMFNESGDSDDDQICKFDLIENNIYFRVDGKYHLLTNRILLNLFELLIQR